jgi:glyoxylase-like metal-dependent hydrolase (beta-lactamase superfamily II)
MTELAPCTLHQISEHVWWFTPDSRTDRASLGLVVGDKGTLMLDIGASPAHTREFLQILNDEGLPPPDSAILTHWHWDHSFGMDALKIPFAAHRDTAKNLQRLVSYDYSDQGLEDLVKRGIEVEFVRDHMIIELDNTQRHNLKLRQPDYIFDDKHHYDLGSASCEVLHVGGDHAIDSCIMYIPEDKVLFMGDCFYHTVYEEPGHYTKEALRLIQKLESFDVEQYIVGHSNQIILSRDIKQWFSIFKQAFNMIDQYGIEDQTLLIHELSKEHIEEDVLDFLHPIIEGYKMKNNSN